MIRPIERLRALLASRHLAVWHHPAYRLPLPTLEGSSGIEPRRADFALWYLRERRLLDPRILRTPPPVAWADLARVHTPDWLESLGRPSTLGRIFAVDPSEIPTDELLATVRLACGGTVAAAREARARGLVAVNLLGGFHHAAPDRGGGLCPVNDLAVALAVARAEGFRGRCVVLDLDAHPPDGTAACLRTDPLSWIGSISGSDWGPLENVDETVLPEGARDDEYLSALERLLRRMPGGQLAFVVAGGDVLAGDRLGRLALTEAGARRRDLLVAEALRGVPQVWLPGGGYRPESWRVLAGTLAALVARSRREIPDDFDPLGARFTAIARSLPTPRLAGPLAGLDLSDVEEQLGLRRPQHRLLLGYYSAEGIEYALHRYGVLPFLVRLGYGPFRIEIGDGPGGSERVRGYGEQEGREHLLIECTLEKRAVTVGDDELPVLYVHWLTLRNPRAKFGDRPPLPGQEVPGLGVAREIVEVLLRMAERLDLAGLAYRPAFLHTAWPARARFRFVDPARQGRFEALLRDLDGLSLGDATRALAEGRVLSGGKPYAWEPDEMVCFLDPKHLDVEASAPFREAARFTVLPPAQRAT